MPALLLLVLLRQWVRANSQKVQLVQSLAANGDCTLMRRYAEAGTC